MESAGDKERVCEMDALCGLSGRVAEGGRARRLAWTLRCRTGTCDTEGPGGQYVP